MLFEQPTLPRQVGRFLLHRLLGRGGMGDVYLATMDGADGYSREVAVKIIRPHLIEEEHSRTEFLKEALLGGKLRHPNIVLTVLLDRIGSVYCLAMELIHGTTLEHVLEDRRRMGRPLPAPVALEIAIQLCEGLDYAHGAMDAQGNLLGIVHRDLKPANVLLSDFGEVKISDFGIARASMMGKSTSTGVVKGTVAYMSPEQARGGRDLDGRSDLYSLGLLLFEMLTLERVYPEAYGIEGLLRVEKADIEPRVHLLEDTPADLKQVILDLLRRERDHRPPSARVVREVLEQLPYASVVARQQIKELVLETLALSAGVGGDSDPTPPEGSESPHFDRTGAAVRVIDSPPLIKMASPREGTPTHPGPSGQSGDVVPMPEDSQSVRLDARAARASSRVTLYSEEPPSVTPLPAPVVAAPPAAAPAPQPQALPEQPADRLPAAAPPSRRVVWAAALLVVALGLWALLRGGGAEGPVAALPLAPPAPAAPAMPAPAAPAPATPAPATPAPATPAPATPAPATPAPRAAEARSAAPSSTKVPSAARSSATPAGPRVGWVNLNSEPASRVFLGNRELGFTPLIRQELPVGRHVLRLEAEGFAAQVREVVVEEGRESALVVVRFN